MTEVSKKIKSFDTFRKKNTTEKKLLQIGPAG